MYLLIYYIFVILPIYQDSFLIKYIDTFGISPIVPFTLIIGPIVLIIKRRIYINKFIKSLIKLEILLFFINVIAISIYIMNGGDIILFQENIILKALKCNLYFVTVIIYLLVITNLIRGMKIEQVLRPFWYILIMLFLVLVIEVIQRPFALHPLHNITKGPYYRIRLLTSESSWTSMQIVIYSLLAISYTEITNKKLNKIMAILMTIIIFLSSQSKGLIIVTGLIILYYIFKINSKVSIKSVGKKIITIMIFIVGVYFIYDKLYIMITDDLTRFTSISTRIYSIFISIIFGFIYPLGVGNGLYTIFFTNLLEKNLNILVNLNLNTSEVLGWINASSDSGISVKSGILQYNLYWGIIGTIIFISSIWKLNKKAIQNLNLSEYKYISKYIEWSFIGAFIFVIGVNSFDYKYEFWTLIGILINFSEIKINSRIIK